MLSLAHFFAAILLFSPGAIADEDPVTALIDVPCSEWRQSPPILSRMEKQSGKAPLRLTVHYTDEPKNLQRSLVEKLRNLFRYSVNEIEGTKKKLWGDIPYHFFIDARGKLGEARSPAYMPDSNTAYPRDGHITIVVEGNPKDGLGLRQRAKLFTLLRALQKKYRVPTGRVGVHKNYAETDCPGEAITHAVQEYKSSQSEEQP
jgi:hypothetical protein